MLMAAPAPVLIGIKRQRSSISSSHQAAENIRYLRPNRWLVAIHHLSVCQSLDGDGKIELFQTSPRSPMQFTLSDETAFRAEVEMRRSLLPQGAYPVIEADVLWFATQVTLVDWEVTGGKPASVQMKIIASSTPSIGARRGDLLLTFGGRDFWLSPDWKRLTDSRPEKPLAAILIPERSGFTHPSQKRFVSKLLPGERFRVRFNLSSPVVIEDNSRFGPRRICR